MLKMPFATGLAVTTVVAGSALAQTTAQTQPAGLGQVLTQMPPDLVRGSQFLGLNVYGGDNQKIGDIDEVLVDRQGKVHGFVVGVGGFLGLGQKDVAIPFDQVQWMSYQEVQAYLTDQSGYGTSSAGGTAPGGANQAPAAGSPGSPGAAATLGGAGAPGAAEVAGTAGNNDTMPAGARVKMTRADLQNAPEFRYSGDANRAGVAGNTDPPPQGVNTPGNTLPNAPRQ